MDTPRAICRQQKCREENQHCDDNQHFEQRKRLTLFYSLVCFHCVPFIHFVFWHVDASEAQSAPRRGAPAANTTAKQSFESDPQPRCQTNHFPAPPRSAARSSKQPQRPSPPDSSSVLPRAFPERFPRQRFPAVPMVSNRMTNASAAGHQQVENPKH